MPFAFGFERCLRLFLWIVEQSARVPGGHFRILGVYEWWLVGFYAGLAVAILDPGELVVEEGVLRLRLRANRIEEGSVPPSAPLVSEWLAEWTSELCTACRTDLLFSYRKQGARSANGSPLAEIMGHQ